jgi:hypothetical protein
MKPAAVSLSSCVGPKLELKSTGVAMHIDWSHQEQGKTGRSWALEPRGDGDVEPHRVPVHAG